MKPEELDDRLADLENVLALHGKRLVSMEERQTQQPEINIPDYTPHFEELKRLIRQLSLAFRPSQNDAQMHDLQKAQRALPQTFPVTHHHHFDDKSRGLLIGGMMLLLVAALSVGLSFGLYRENTRMKENDIKFRMIRQSIPETAKWADTTYHRNPEATEKILKRLEEEQLGIMNNEIPLKP
jgi:hypothetical protein